MPYMDNQQDHFAALVSSPHRVCKSDLTASLAGIRTTADSVALAHLQGTTF